MNFDIPFTKADDKLRQLLLGFIVLVLVALVAYVAGAWGKYEDGRAAVRAEWQKAEFQRSQAEAKAIAERLASNKHIADEQLETNRRIAREHESTIERLRLAAAADLAAVRRAGGLRISRAVCDSAAARTETASAGGRDETTAETVRLPIEVEDALWRIALDSDEVVEQARACQNWIVANGFAEPVTKE